MITHPTMAKVNLEPNEDHAHQEGLACIAPA